MRLDKLLVPPYYTTTPPLGDLTNGGNLMLYPYTTLDYLTDMIDKSQLNALGQSHAFTEKDSYYLLEAAIPGADKAEINITVSSENVLNISYSPAKKNPHAPSFSKLWALKNADYDGLTAEYTNGILKVVVPKVKAYQTKARTFAVN